jgi:3-carboxy-cis,cis-muconate cycloisomerase
MSFSPFDHPILSGLLGDDEMAALFSAEAELAAMLHFEVALARAQAEAGLIPDAAAVAIAKMLVTFRPDITALRAATAIDGVSVPELLRQLRHEIGEDAAECLHIGATSQDVIDGALMMRLKPALAIIEQRLSALIAGLDDLAARHGSGPLMGHTRMQAALPITAGDRIASWVEPCRRNLARLRAITEAGLPIQLGGPVGNLAELGEAGPRIRALCAAELGLVDAQQWHSQRDALAEIANTLSLTTGSIGKLGQDVALMAQAGTIDLAGGGGSSAMPHKHNPVAAEVLVTLARFNATQLAGMHHALVHEQERSGAVWTLEWMLLPQMVCATAASLRHAAALVGDIRRMGESA